MVSASAPLDLELGPNPIQFFNDNTVLPKGCALYSGGGQELPQDMETCSPTLNLLCGCTNAGKLDWTGPLVGLLDRKPLHFLALVLSPSCLFLSLGKAILLLASRQDIGRKSTCLMKPHHSHHLALSLHCPEKK